MKRQIKGFTPKQMLPVNQHRAEKRMVKATGLSFWGKCQIAAAVLMAAGIVMVGGSMIYCLAVGWGA